MQGGMEAIYEDITRLVGFLRFAPVEPARGAMFSAAHRAAKQHAAEPVVSERELYGPINVLSLLMRITLLHEAAQFDSS